MKLAIILAEYGKTAPDITQYRETWPEAEIQVFSGKDLPDVPELDPQHPRYGWRMNDYWKVKRMLESGADVAMCFDGDMRIVDREAARTLPLITERFGVCLPINPRYLFSVDNGVGADAQTELGEEPGTLTSVNCSPITIAINQRDARMMADVYCDLMLTQPVRGPVAWSWAMWQAGVAPMILAPQWCVCERHIGCGNEIIIHEGHTAVKRAYAGMGTDGRWKNGG